MTLDEIVDLAFSIYGNEVIDKSYIDQLISDYISAGDVRAEEYNNDDIDVMFKRLFEVDEKDYCNVK